MDKCEQHNDKGNFMKFESILSDKFEVDRKELHEVDNIRESLVTKWSEKITETINEWCLNNYQRATGFITQHLDYWDVDQFHIIYQQHNNNLVDYTLTHKGQFLSRLIISHNYRYKIENDDGFIDEGELHV